MLMGIDIGTGSTKGVLARLDGEIVATATRSHQMSLPRPGWAEMDAEAIWWGDVAAISRELKARAGGAPIAGLCVSGLGPCLLVADEQTRPLRDAILYGIDMRATAEIEELTERLGAERIIERCGKALSTQAVGPKLLWLRRHEPDLWERVRRWYSANGFVVARLTGEYVIDHQPPASAIPSTTSPATRGRRTSQRRWRPDCRCRGWHGQAKWSERSRPPPRSRPGCPGAPRFRPGPSTPGPRRSARGSAPQAISCSCTAPQCSSYRCSTASRRTPR